MAVGVGSGVGSGVGAGVSVGTAVGAGGSHILRAVLILFSAGRKGKNHAERQDQGNCFFHVFLLFYLFVLSYHDWDFKSRKEMLRNSVQKRFTGSAQILHSIRKNIFLLLFLFDPAIIPTNKGF